MNVSNFTRPLLYAGLTSPALNRDTRELTRMCVNTDQSQSDSNRNIGALDVSEIGARAKIAYKAWGPIESETYRLVSLESPDGATKEIATSVRVADGNIRVAEVTKDTEGNYRGVEYAESYSVSQSVKPQSMDPLAARAEFHKVCISTLDIGDPFQTWS